MGCVSSSILRWSSASLCKIKGLKKGKKRVSSRFLLFRNQQYEHALRNFFPRPAKRDGTHLLFIPTFITWGQKHHSQNKTPILGKAKPVLRVKLKRGWYVFWIFFKIGLYVQPYHSKGLGESFPLMWLKIGLCFKNYHNTYYPQFSFTPKTGVAFPTTGVFFYCDIIRRREKIGKSLLMIFFPFIRGSKKTCA